MSNSLLNADDELVRFRDQILTKWGFLPFYEPHTTQRQYVHVSGSMFVMIPYSTWIQEDEAVKNSNTLPSPTAKMACDKTSPLEEYITRHFSGVRQTSGDKKENKKIKVRNDDAAD